MLPGRIGLLLAITHGCAAVVQRNATQFAEFDAEPEFLAAREREQFAQRIKVEYPAQGRDHGEPRRKAR
ncbi:hypothetical protein D3C84_788340 [compost metagenome]